MQFSMYLKLDQLLHHLYLHTMDIDHILVSEREIQQVPRSIRGGDLGESMLGSGLSPPPESPGLLAGARASIGGNPLEGGLAGISSLAPLTPAIAVSDLGNARCPRRGLTAWLCLRACLNPRFWSRPPFPGTPRSLGLRAICRELLSPACLACRHLSTRGASRSADRPADRRSSVAQKLVLNLIRLHSSLTYRR